MNSMNASTGFSNFQLCLGHSPRIIPPIIPDGLTEPISVSSESICTQIVIDQLQTDVAEAKDNLLQAEMFQTHYANLNRSPKIPFSIGDKVMLSTLHCHQEFKKKGEKWAAKFYPRYDGPFNIIDVHTGTSNYTLELPNTPNTYPTYHSSELRSFIPNNPILFPVRKLPEPHPVITSDGLEEFLVQEIIDSRRHGRGYQYLVRWSGYGPKHDRWLTASSLEDCEALDIWLNRQGTATW